MLASYNRRYHVNMFGLYMKSSQFLSIHMCVWTMGRTRIKI